MYRRRTVPNDLRHLTLNHARAVKLRNSGASLTVDEADDRSKLTKLDPGYEKLYSHFTPALAGGEHSIRATQSIAAPGDKPLQPIHVQKFSVKAPQYQLPEGVVDSHYPPDGAECPAETLAHVVFNDAHLPWERTVAGLGNERERTPWLCLLTFAEDELRLAPELLNGESSLVNDTDLARDARKAGKEVKQSSDFALEMSISDFHKVKRVECPVVASDTDRGHAVFIRKELFDLLTRAYDASGAFNPEQDRPDVSRYKYLAHIRHSRPRRDDAIDPPDALHSVVQSHRLSSLLEDKPSRTVVHLLSLEGWSNIERKKLLSSSDKDYVLALSLLSWSYVGLPVGASNVYHAMRNLGSGLNVLGPSENILKLAFLDTSRRGQRLAQRLKDGYTLVKYYTTTGEETVGLIRGALSPCVPPDKLADGWDSMSFSGKDFQIFDQNLGMMDLTYSTAWSLGKVMALADSSFVTSLGRLRLVAEAHSLNSAKAEILDQTGVWSSKTEILSSMVQSIGLMNAVSRGEHGHPAPTSVLRAVDDSSQKPLDLSLDSLKLNEIAELKLQERIRHLVGALDKEGKEFFNELNNPRSKDWMIVLKWIMDKLYLFGVPAQYLLIEPTWLPNESLRFFYIDHHWMDAYIDGALSLSNHMDSEDDRFRRILKGALNTYFATPDSDLKYKPQIPTYGCLLRSDLVKAFPDLKIAAPIPSLRQQPLDVSKDVEKPHERAPILRQDRLSEDIVICLFDRIPGADELRSLSFTQPAHQQCFIVGDSITAKQLKLSYRQAYTKSLPPNTEYRYKTIQVTYENNEELVDELSNASQSKVLIWGKNSEARFLNLPGLMKDALTKLKELSPDYFDDNVGSSALVGYQLGTPVYQLTLVAPGLERMETMATSDQPRQFAMLRPRSTNRSRLSQLLWGLEVPSNIAELRGLLHSEGLGSPMSLKVLARDEMQYPRIRLRSILPSTHFGVRARAVPVEQQGDGGASAPKFQYKVYPLDDHEGKIVTNTSYAQDLVFSIKLVSGSTYKYSLQKIMVQIPFGPKDNPQDIKRLMEEYRGPGPVMLRNLRFNVILSVSEGFLDMTILPRSKTGQVHVSKIRECSFMLPLVRVIQYTEPRGLYVMLRHWEYWDQGPVQGGETDDIPIELGPRKGAT